MTTYQTNDQIITLHDRAGGHPELKEGMIGRIIYKDEEILTVKFECIESLFVFFESELDQEIEGLPEEETLSMAIDHLLIDLKVKWRAPTTRRSTDELQRLAEEWEPVPGGGGQPE